MPNVLNRLWATRAIGLAVLAMAGQIVPAWAASGGSGELNLPRYAADRPQTADVERLSLRWKVSTLAGEPYVTYAVKWTLGQNVRGDGTSGAVKSGERKHVRIARAAVLRARVVAPGCDRCAWLEFVVPKAVASDKAYTEDVSVSPPWGKLLAATSGKPGSYMSEAAAREVLAGPIQLADLELSEPRFDLGAAGRAVKAPTAPTGGTSCGRLYCD